MDVDERCQAERLAAFLKTMGGAVFHELKFYGRSELTGGSWGHICLALGIPAESIHSIENLSDTGFFISTRVLSIAYTHDEWDHLRRVVKVTYHSTSKSKADPQREAFVKSKKKRTKRKFR